MVYNLKVGGAIDILNKIKLNPWLFGSEALRQILFPGLRVGMLAIFFLGGGGVVFSVGKP